MSIKIALAGNPNSGKTTMFNTLTGSNQQVGNWPGVTVDKKEGILKGHPDVIIQDLPGIYSLSPYSLEEVVTREYLVKEKPDAILNIVDGTNIERNLYLTTQLLELGIPVVVAVNMIDVVRKKGDSLDLEQLSKAFKCPFLETSALEGEGGLEAAELAVTLAEEKKPIRVPAVFSGSLEHAVAHIEEEIEDVVEHKFLRWYALKLFERDIKVQEELNLSEETLEHINKHIIECEEELEDDAESIVINQRYEYITALTAKAVKKHSLEQDSTSNKIDNIVTNRILALPIFALIMFLVYYISISTVGDFLTEWTNETLFGEIISPNLQEWLENMAVSDWLVGLIIDGIVAGVGAVIGFVPQMLVLFCMLAILEDIGYMARVAFIMDKLFRKLGLSGKSFIPLLVASGCGVPGVMASRTVEQERDRRMTIMTTCFIPCSAKMPMIGLFSGAIFNNSGLVATSAYFVGIGAVIVSGIILKKTKLFAGDPAPFVMELPQYHMPIATNILKTTMERGISFIKKAGTIILVSSIVLWFLQAFGYVDGSLEMVDEADESILAVIGNTIAPLFYPLGFGTWQATVATFTGLIAKENVVGTFGVLYGFAEVAEDGEEIWSNLAKDFTFLSAYSFLIFNLLCAPCFAAMGAIKREMNNAKWTWIALGYMTGFAYVCAFIFYQLGSFVTGGEFDMFTALASIAVAGMLYLLFRAPYNGEKQVG